jgi:agmatine deiminase
MSVARPRSAPAGDPARLGFRMPGEWEPHVGTWIAWPHERSDWPGHFSRIPEVYVGIVSELARGERVHIIVGSLEAERQVARSLARAGVAADRVGFHRWPTDRSWVRDSGPTFVTRAPRGPRPGGVGAVSWRFNAWAKYDNWHRDVTIASRVARAARVPTWRPTWHGRRVVLEGGAIDSNGAGLILTTEECLLGAEQVRNPGWDRRDWAAVFHRFLGAKRVVWLPRGIVGDDTHGHVDDVARFVGPTTAVAAVEPNIRDPNSEALAENLERLHADLPRTFAVHELPMPAEIWLGRQRLPASYANFYIANRSVLVPVFDDPADREGLRVLRGLFPGRRVVGIPSRDLVVGLGTLHCLTQPEFASIGSAGAESSRGSRSTGR